MDVADLIYQCLLSKWTETNPDSANVAWREMEFDPKNPNIQILIENYPERSVWVSQGTYRIEHRVKITIYLKLIRYEPTTVATMRTTWFNLKQEISNILAKNKYAIEGIINLDLPGGWDDINSIAVGRGIKSTKEPIIWQAEQVVKTVYYNNQILEED